MKVSSEAMLGAILAAIAILIAVIALIGLNTYITNSMPLSAYQSVVSLNQHLTSKDEGSHLWFGEWTERTNESKYATVQIMFPTRQTSFQHIPQVTVSINGFSFADEFGMMQVSVYPGSISRDGFILLIEQRKRDSELHWLDIQWTAIGD